MPTLVGDYFAGSLTYICHHDDEGAMGLIINRPSNFSLYELLSETGMATADAQKDQMLSQQVFEGGPVSTERGFVLHSLETTYPGTQTLDDQLAISTTMETLVQIGQGRVPEAYLVALGYAGWGAQQLESEIQNNIWLTTPGDMKAMFQATSDKRLETAVGWLGMSMAELALVANPGHA